MHLIQSLKNEFSFDLPMFSKYPATSINSYFYKMTLYMHIINEKCHIYTGTGNQYQLAIMLFLDAVFNSHIPTMKLHY